MKQIVIAIFSLFIFQIGFCQSKESNITEILNISYLEKDQIAVDSLQRLNLVLPTNKTTCPLFIWIGGGAWAFVDRHKEMVVARKLAEQGIAVASIGHRLSPATWQDPKFDKGIEHPKHVEDVAMAIKWLYDNASNYVYDKEQIFIGGYSCGAHLSALVSLDDTYLNNVGLSQKVIKGAIPISGAYDIIKYHDGFLEGSRPELAELHVKGVFGQTMEQLSQASPTNYIEKDEMPLLIITDSQVGRYTKPFEDKLIEKEYTDVQVIYDYSRNHKTLWEALSSEESTIYRDLILDFIQRNIRS